MRRKLWSAGVVVFEKTEAVLMGVAFTVILIVILALMATESVLIKLRIRKGLSSELNSGFTDA